MPPASKAPPGGTPGAAGALYIPEEVGKGFPMQSTPWGSAGPQPPSGGARLWVRGVEAEAEGTFPSTDLGLGVTSAHGMGRSAPHPLSGQETGGVQSGSGWRSGGSRWGSSWLPHQGVQACPRLTVELLSEEREEDGEVDGALALLQHGV